jgi:hypothetical protein
VTYGEQLDATAAALARALAALRRASNGDSLDHVAAAIARAQLYRALERQIVLVDGGSGRRLAQVVRRATARTGVDLPAAPRPMVPAAVALTEAAEAATIASEILASHIGHGAEGAPRTSDGAAVLAGVDRSDNLAQLAQLAKTAGEVDRALARWLDPDYATRPDRQKLITAAAADAKSTGAALPPVAAAQAAHGDPDRAPLRSLAPSPATDDPHRWATPTSPAECVAAVDAARAWLLRHPEQLTARHLGEISRTGLALTHDLGQLLTATGNPGANEATAALAHRWRNAATAADALRSPIRHEPTTATEALAGAERWLRDQLRHGGQWLPGAAITQTPEAAEAWRSAARELAARMPDLATLVHRGAEHALQNGNLIAPTGRLHKPPGSLVQVAQWTVAQSATPQASTLVNTTRALREPAVRLAEAAGGQPRAGLHEAQTRRRNVVRDKLREAAATKPIDARRVVQTGPTREATVGQHPTRTADNNAAAAQAQRAQDRVRQLAQRREPPRPTAAPHPPRPNL